MRKEEQSVTLEKARPLFLPRKAAGGTSEEIRVKELRPCEAKGDTVEH